MEVSGRRYALVSSSYHPHVGGVEEHVRQVAAGLRERGNVVEIWTVARETGVGEALVEGCRVRYLPAPLPARDLRAFWHFLVRAPRALGRWMQAYRSLRPDVINIQCFGPNGVYATVLSRMVGVPLVVSSHGETFADEHGVFDRSALLRVSLRRAVQVGLATGCSPVVADDLRTRFSAPEVHVVPNGVATEHRSYVGEGVAPAHARPLLLGVGRLVPQKGFDLLLEAAARSRAQPDVWIVGDGAQRGPLEALAQKLGLAERVQFLGRQAPSQVGALMQQSSVVVVPSRTEAFGMVVLEAWAHGIPLVATDRGGPAGIVTDGHDGLLVDPENVDSLARTIDRVLNDRALALRLSRSGLETVAGYTWSRVVDAYCELFTQVIELQFGAEDRGSIRRANK